MSVDTLEQGSTTNTEQLSQEQIDGLVADLMSNPFVLNDTQYEKSLGDTIGLLFNDLIKIVNKDEVSEEESERFAKVLAIIDSDVTIYNPESGKLTFKSVPEIVGSVFVLPSWDDYYKSRRQEVFDQNMKQSLRIRVQDRGTPEGVIIDEGVRQSSKVLSGDSWEDARGWQFEHVVRVQTYIELSQRYRAKYGHLISKVHQLIEFYHQN